MNDSGAERAALAELKEQDARFDPLFVPDEVRIPTLQRFRAAIIREETGTRLEPNHHWKWFLNYGEVHCPHKDQEWHKATPQLCRPCDYARHAALDYMAAVPDEGGKL